MRSLVRSMTAVLVILPPAVIAPAISAQAISAQAPAMPAALRPLAIEDYYRLKVVGAPELSPNARWVAFTVGTRVEATNGTDSEVWLVSTDGVASARRASAAGANATAPRWLEDGRLAYTAGGKEMSLDPSGSPAADRVDSGTVQAGARRGVPALLRSADGKWVASLRDIAQPKQERVFASDFEKRHEERFKGVQFDWLEFQRDGAAFPVPDPRSLEGNPAQEVFLSAAANDSGARQLTRMGVRPAGLQWSPDGTSLLFTGDSAYRNERSYGRSDVYVVSREGGGTVRRLTTNADYDYDGARFSPDGRWILATRSTPTDIVIARKMTNGGPTDLVIIPATGGPERVLTADWDYLPGAARWSTDGRFVYFTGGVGGTTHLFRVSTGGGAVEQVTKGERRVTGISFDRSLTTIAYLVGRFDAPSEIYVAKIDGTGEKQLTRVNDAFAREIAVSRSERLQFRSADGTQVEGFLLLPYGYRADGGPYPLVVANHGGPHSAVGYNFDFKNQYFAANGYAVLEVNFRSSTGYGEQFLWATWGAWGTRDGQDVMAGIDYVLARYPVDRARVATMGHSYGGFMTNWLITQYPDRFAAAISGAGISNWMSDYGTADIARTKETEFYGTPWDANARELMLKQSPLIYANRVKAPTLFIHGEVDQRVPYSEAEQMYVALKKNGVPAKVIQYAGMPHGISGSWNNVHRMLNERAWLDRYLKTKM